jgi:hypothetical protein
MMEPVGVMLEIPLTLVGLGILRHQLAVGEVSLSLGVLKMVELERITLGPVQIIHQVQRPESTCIQKLVVVVINRMLLSHRLSSILAF